MSHRIAYRTSGSHVEEIPLSPPFGKGGGAGARGDFWGEDPQGETRMGGWCGSVHAGDRRGFLGGGHQQAAFPGMQMALNRQVLADHLGLLERSEQTWRAVQPD